MTRLSTQIWTPSASRSRAARLASSGVEARQDARPGFDQDHARQLRVDAPEVARQREPAHLADRAGELDAGRAAADDHERQPLLAQLGIALALGELERGQDAAADLGRLLERLEAGREALPPLLAEVGVLRAGCDDRVVVGHARRNR